MNGNARSTKSAYKKRIEANCPNLARNRIRASIQYQINCANTKRSKHRTGLPGPSEQRNRHMDMRPVCVHVHGLTGVHGDLLARSSGQHEEEGRDRRYDDRDDNLVGGERLEELERHCAGFGG